MRNRLEVQSGDYKFIQRADGSSEALRHGEPWRDTTGDNFILSLASDLDDAKQRIAELERERDEWMAGVRNFRCPNCKSVAGPLYPVNLMSAIATLTEALRKLQKYVCERTCMPHHTCATSHSMECDDARAALAKAGVE